MSAQFEQYRFDEDALREMNNFKKDFMSNRYKKDTSENKGPNYKKTVLLDDQKAFEEYLDDADSQDFFRFELTNVSLTISQTLFDFNGLL